MKVDVTKEHGKLGTKDEYDYIKEGKQMCLQTHSVDPALEL